MNIHQPFRVVVAFRTFERGKTRAGRRGTGYGAYSPIKPVTAAVVLWSEDTTAEPWRAGYGSFLFSDIHKTSRAVSAALRDARTTQVQVRTNQDRTLFVYNRLLDGRVTSYKAID